MITNGDTILALSNSGETTELSDIVGYARRHHIPLVSMTSKPDSTLAQNSTVALVLPPHTEVCPHGLAPTTSALMMLALGDALAMAMLNEKGFTARDFGSIHPGGKLGQQLMLVSQLMHTQEQLPLVQIESPLHAVIIEMTSKGFGCAAVLDKGYMAGIITDGDLRRHLHGQTSADVFSLKASDLLSAQPKTITPDTLAMDALALMHQHKITSLFVVEGTGSNKGHKPIGILHLHDCLRAGLT